MSGEPKVSMLMGAPRSLSVCARCHSTEVVPVTLRVAGLSAESLGSAGVVTYVPVEL